MTKETVYFVKFFAPGSFFAEEWTQPIESPDPKLVQWPAHAYAFSLHQRTDVVDGDDRYHGEITQVGPLYYYPGSKVETLEEVKRNPSSTDMLVRNMKWNGWDRIIWTRWGNWPQPYDHKRMTVLPDGWRDGEVAP